MKENIYNIIQLVLGLAIIITVLLQQKGSGLSQVFGGSSNIYSTRRGVDKVLHYTTIISATLFFLFSLVRLVF